MPSLLTTSVFLLLSTLSLLQVYAEGFPPFRSLEKRGICLVPNEAKGCSIWGIDSCCQQCCAKYADGRAPESWKHKCHCHDKKPIVVAVAPQTVTLTPVAQPVTYAVQPQPVYVIHQ